MSETKIRELERRIAADKGDTDAQQGLLAERARIGEIEIIETKDGWLYEARPWTGARTDVYGNNRACQCPELKRLVGIFCVCYGKCWCPTHGGPRCVGGHD